MVITDTPAQRSKPGYLNLLIMTLRLTPSDSGKRTPLVLLLSCVAAAWGQTDLTLTLQTNTRYQTLDNFGTSAAFELNEITDAWDEENLNPLAELLFSTEIEPDGSLTGIGLSGFRVEIGACSRDQGDDSEIDRFTARTKCPLRPDSSYDWSRMDAELWWARKAHEYGVHSLLGYSNSPPIYFTRNGLACRSQNSPFASNLRPDAYGDFAEYLARVAAHFEEEGTPLHYISPINEPQWEWECDRQEGTQWTSAEIRDLVIELQPAFERHDVSAKVSITEAGQIDYIYNNQNGNALARQLKYWDPSDSLYIGNLSVLAKKIAGHSYWTENSDIRMLSTRSNLATAVAATDPELTWWQSEYSFLGNGFRDLSQDPTRHELGLFMAKVMHVDLTVGNAAAWQFWETFESTSGLPRFRLVEIDRDDQSVVQREKTYWALGHYSRFIRPGMQRVRVDRSDDLTALQTMRDVMPTAFVNPASGGITLVAVNYREDARTLRIVVPGMADTTRVAYWLSTDDQDMARQDSFRLADTLMLPARSIATFVIGTQPTVSLRPGSAQENPLNRVRVRKSGGRTFLVHQGENFPGTQRVLIRDLRGRAVFEASWKFPFAEIHLPLKAGVYLLSLSGEKGTKPLVLH